MDKNILLETTVKSFENGIKEVTNIKESLDKLGNMFKDLFDNIEFNEVKNNVEDLKQTIGELNNTADGFHNKLLSLIKDLEIDDFKNKCKSTDNIIKKIYENIESDYREIHSEYEKIQTVPISLKEFEENITMLKNKLDKDQLQENTKNILKVLESFKSEAHEKSNKYFELNKSMYEKSIDNIKEIQNYILEVDNQAFQFQKNMSELCDIMSSEKFLDTAREVNRQMETLNNQCFQISDNFKNLMNINIHENNIIQELKENKNTTQLVEERMGALEEKINSLIEENQNLNKLYSQKNNLDKEFENKILSVINKNLKSDSNSKVNFKIAEMYYHGVEKDINVAVKYYEEAAKNKDDSAYNKVIEIYKDKVDRGGHEYSICLADFYVTMKEFEKAKEWYKKAKESGNTIAEYMLSKLENL